LDKIMIKTLEFKTGTLEITGNFTDIPMYSVFFRGERINTQTASLGDAKQRFRDIKSTLMAIDGFSFCQWCSKMMADVKNYDLGNYKEELCPNCAKRAKKEYKTVTLIEVV